MKLQYLLEPAYDELWDNVPENIEQYETNADWLETFFDSRKYSKESTVEVPKPELLITPGIMTDEQKSIDDLANVRIVYDAFNALSPLQATNKFLWTYLSHVTYKNYVHKRWLQEKSNDPERTIKTRFFVTGNRTSLYDNAIARLWWYGYISYDEEKPGNPYHLTKILLMNQTIATDFVETGYSHNKTIGKGVLLALNDFVDEWGTKKGITDPFRDFNKYLNRYGAVSSLDALTSDDIYEITLKWFRTTFAKKKKEG